MDDTDSEIVGTTTYSKVAYFTNSSIEPTSNILIETGITGTQIDEIDTVNTYFNYDVRSLFNSTETVSQICLSSGLDSSDIACDTEKFGIVEIDQIANAKAATSINLNITKGASTGVTQSFANAAIITCLLYTSPSPRDATLSRMPSSA